MRAAQHFRGRREGGRPPVSFDRVIETAGQGRLTSNHHHPLIHRHTATDHVPRFEGPPAAAAGARGVKAERPSPISARHACCCGASACSSRRRRLERAPATHVRARPWLACRLSIDQRAEAAAVIPWSVRSEAQEAERGVRASIETHNTTLHPSIRCSEAAHQQRSPCSASDIAFLEPTAAVLLLLGGSDAGPAGLPSRKGLRSTCN